MKFALASRVIRADLGLRSEGRLRRKRIAVAIPLFRRGVPVLVAKRPGIFRKRV